MDRFNPLNLFRKTKAVSSYTSTSTSAPGPGGKGRRVDPSGTRRAYQPQGSSPTLTLQGQQSAMLRRLGDGKGDGNSTGGLLSPGSLVTDSGMPAALYWPGVPEVMHGYLDDPADRAIYPPRLTPATPTSGLSPQVWDAHPIDSQKSFLLHPGQSVWISTDVRPAVVYEAVVAGHYVHERPVAVALFGSYQPDPGDALVVRPRGHWDPESLGWKKPYSGEPLECVRDSAGNPWVTLRRDSGVIVHARKLARVPRPLYLVRDLGLFGPGRGTPLSAGTRLLLPVYYGWGGNPHGQLQFAHGGHHLPVHFVRKEGLNAMTVLARQSLQERVSYRFDPQARRPAHVYSATVFGCASAILEEYKGEHEGWHTFPGILDAHPIPCAHRISGEGFHEHFGNWAVSSRPVGDGWFEIRLIFTMNQTISHDIPVSLLPDFYPDSDEPGEALLRRLGGTGDTDTDTDMPPELGTREVLDILLQYQDERRQARALLRSLGQPRRMPVPPLLPAQGLPQTHQINSAGAFLLPPGTPVRVSSPSGTGPVYSGIVAGSVIQSQAMEKARSEGNFPPSVGDALVVYCGHCPAAPAARHAGAPQVDRAPGCGTWVTLRRTSDVVVHADTHTTPPRMLASADLFKLPEGTPLLWRVGLYAWQPPKYSGHDPAIVDRAQRVLQGSQDLPVLLGGNNGADGVSLIAHWSLQDMRRTAGSLAGQDLLAEPLAPLRSVEVTCLDRRGGAFEIFLRFHSGSEPETGLFMNPFYTGGSLLDGFAPSGELDDESPLDDKGPREHTANDLYEPVWGGPRARISSRMSRQEARALQPGDRVNLRLKEKGSVSLLDQFQTGASVVDRVESLEGDLELLLALDGARGTFRLRVEPGQEMPLIWGRGLAFGDDKSQIRGRNLDAHLECTVASLDSVDELETLLDTERVAGRPSPRVNLVLPGAEDGEDFVVTGVVREGDQAFASIEARQDHPILKDAPNQQTVTTTSGVREYQVLLKFERSSGAGHDDKAPAGAGR